MWALRRLWVGRGTAAGMGGADSDGRHGWGGHGVRHGRGAAAEELEVFFAPLRQEHHGDLAAGERVLCAVDDRSRRCRACRGARSDRRATSLMAVGLSRAADMGGAMGTARGAGRRSRCATRSSRLRAASVLPLNWVDF
jgi:hypothetical protein